MRIANSWATLALLGLFACDEAATVTPPPPAVESRQPETTRDSFEAVPQQATQLLVGAHNWLQAVNGLNSTRWLPTSTSTYPSVGAYLQVAEGADLDGPTLRAALEARGYTVTQVLTPTDTGIAGGYILECANFG